MTITETAPWLEGVDAEELEALRVADPHIALRVEEIARALWSFVWIDSEDPENSRGEVDVYVEDGRAMISLQTWVHDSEDLTNRNVQPLITTTAVDGTEAREQIRAIIHWHLCHEADEFMDFGGEKPFWPHHEGEA